MVIITKNAPFNCVWKLGSNGIVTAKYRKYCLFFGIAAQHVNYLQIQTQESEYGLGGLPKSL